jgi:hypothetical protein
MAVTISAEFDREIRAVTQGVTNVFAGSGTTARVSAALFAYHESVRMGQAYSQQGAYLLEVVKACRKWVSDKKEEKQKKASKETENTKARKRIIVRVQKEAEADLKQNPVVLNLLPSSNQLQRAEARYRAQKQTARNNPQLLPATTALQPGYAHEQTVYARCKQAGAIQAHGQFHDPQAPRMVPSGTLLKGGALMNHDQFAQITLQQFEQLDAQFNKQYRVLFFSRLQRMKYLIAAEDGIFYRAVDGTRITCSNQAVKFDVDGNGSEVTIYACDKHGNLYLLRPEESLIKNTLGANVQVNHSTLCAGKPVLCAGTISIKNGVLKAISNQSGHYAPDANALKHFLRFLQDRQQVDLTSVVVNDLQYGITTTAARFLNNNHADMKNDPFVKGVWDSTN